MDQYLELRLEHKKRAPTYVYLFTHKAAASFTEIFKGGRENYWGKLFIASFFRVWEYFLDLQWIMFFYFSITGVSHAEELQYLFPIAESLFISALPTKDDEDIRKGITQLWVDFARSGYENIAYLIDRCSFVWFMAIIFQNIKIIQKSNTRIE